MLGFHYAQTDSTNLLARRLAAINPGQPLVVSAVVQTSGRGREGRAWSSPPGGAWFTIAWPLLAQPSVYRTAPLAVGLAVHETLTTLLPSTASLAIKWPNDLLLQNRKVAGILCEMDVCAQGLLMVGVGINVNLDPAMLGTNLRWPATSLQHVLGRRVQVSPLIERCADRIADRLTELETQGLAGPMQQAIQQRLAWVGKPVTLQWQGRSVSGCCRGINEQGALVLKGNGPQQVFDAGEISGLSLGTPAPDDACPADCTPAKTCC